MKAATNYIFGLILLVMLPVFTVSAKKANTSAYLFVYFTGNRVEEEQICFALSEDGYNYKALNGGNPVINSKDISMTGGVRDPHILRAEDGKTFYMVATDMTSSKGWNSNRGMVLLKSTDLVKWTSTAIHIPTVFPTEFGNILRVWAPQTIYDPVAKKYMVYFSMLKEGQGEYDKIYYSYVNKDFTALETVPKQLFYSPDQKSCIDGDIVLYNGKYHLFFKTEGHGNGIKKAVSDKLTEGWVLQDKYLQQTTSAVEGAGVFKLNNSPDWILMYDMYTSGRYQFTRSSDLENFKLIDEEVSMDFHPRHGTVLPITQKEAQRLQQKWAPVTEVLCSVAAPAVKKINVTVDTEKKTIFLPVLPGTDLKNFDPQFTDKNLKIKPAGAVDFSKGAVSFKMSMFGKKAETYTVSAAEMHNPALAGLYADPDILYSNKTGKFYIYPTSDGFNGWSGTYFKCFSSPDLVSWTDEGKIITLGTDVKWADRNAWAPCIVEKKIDGHYKYFYYFTAAQKIGVAVADNPEGPFVDSGKALIDTRPDGITRGQVIDPDVFTDPVSGKTYLYWGNGFAAGAELNDDMVSVNTATLKILNVPGSFREGSHVLYRDGKYYFMWSIDDTRSPNYAVGYAFMSSPLGELTVPENNVILKKDESKGIYGTGHHSTIQISGRDEWYIVYHRFNYPNGIKMGGAAGFNREVCIDKMEFNADGTIKPVVVTHEGVAPVKVK